MTAGSTKFSYYDAKAPRLISISPSGAPTSPGGAVLTVSGSGFQDAISAGVSLWCVFGKVPFSAVVQNNETAVCVAPMGLPIVKGKLFVSFNALDPAGTDTLDFAVYEQPRITAIWPMGGYGDEPIMIQAAGLGFTFQPREGDIRCVFLQQHQEKVVTGHRVGNSSVISCLVPNNTRDEHIISGEARVEISLIGEQRSVYAHRVPVICLSLLASVSQTSPLTYACLVCCAFGRCTRITLRFATTFTHTAAATAIFFTQRSWLSFPTAPLGVAALTDTCRMVVTALHVPRGSSRRQGITNARTALSTHTARPQAHPRAAVAVTAGLLVPPTAL